MRSPICDEKINQKINNQFLECFLFASKNNIKNNYYLLKEHWKLVCTTWRNEGSVNKVTKKKQLIH